VKKGKAPCVREALLYEAQPSGAVKCGTCERRCEIQSGGRGFCGARENIDGKLYTLTYGDLSSISVNPIERKPLFNYWPGSKALSAGSWGCSLRCIYCQNHELSMVDADPSNCSYVSPENFVDLALRKEAQGLSFTFNEASSTLLEYMIDCFKLAKERNLYCNLNTNGYMTLEALRRMREAGLDSLCIDLKGDEAFYRRFCNGADVEVVWRNAREAKKMGIHIEMVNLVVPGGNDSEACIEEIIQRVKGELGSETPLHFTRFYPDYRAQEYGLDRVTPVETLEESRQRAREEGLDYVYIGNVPGHPGENTYCPDCGSLLIQRYIFSVLEYRITENHRCPNCNRQILIVGKHIQS
jgi:pyruvate formate lyase activating enzyme